MESQFTAARVVAELRTDAGARFCNLCCSLGSDDSHCWPPLPLVCSGLAGSDWQRTAVGTGPTRVRPPQKKGGEEIKHCSGRVKTWLLSHSCIVPWRNEMSLDLCTPDPSSHLSCLYFYGNFQACAAELSQPVAFSRWLAVLSVTS